MPRFETFTKTVAARSREPHVTIQRRGTITLNAAAYASLGSPEAVELLFDEQLNTIGLRTCDVKVEHASFVRPASHSVNGPFVVSAMAFLKHYGVDTTVARRWPVTVDGAILCVDLQGSSEDVSRTGDHDSDNGSDRGRRTAHRRPRPGPR